MSHLIQSFLAALVALGALVAGASGASAQSPTLVASSDPLRLPGPADDDALRLAPSAESPCLMTQATRDRRVGAALISLGISAVVPGTLGILLWAWAQHDPDAWLGGSIALASGGAILLGFGAWLRARGNSRWRRAVGGLSLGVDGRGAQVGWSGVF